MFNALMLRAGHNWYGFAVMFMSLPRFFSVTF